MGLDIVKSLGPLGILAIYIVRQIEAGNDVPEDVKNAIVEAMLVQQSQMETYNKIMDQSEIIKDHEKAGLN